MCLTLWDPMDCSLPGSSVHGIFQARVLEWVAISFSRGSSQPRDWTQVSCIAGIHFTIWGTGEVTINRRWGSILSTKILCHLLSLLRGLHLGPMSTDFPDDASGKAPGCQCRSYKECGCIPESGRSPGGGHSNLLQYSCLENPMNRGVWWATVHRVSKNQTRLKWLKTNAPISIIISYFSFLS